MQQIAIDAVFLNSCFHTFLDSHFYKPIHASFFPIIYETIDSSILGTVTHKKKLKSCNYSSYTGFIVSFYPSGQLDIFGYIKSGTLYAFIKLEQGRESGVSDYSVEYRGHEIPCSSEYVNGKSIEPPFIWGDDDIIREINFTEWVKQEIHYVINCGFYHQRKN